MLKVEAYLCLVVAMLLLVLTGCCSMFSPAPPTCPGDIAIFHCTVNDTGGTGITQWLVNGNTCFLPHHRNETDTCGPESSFHAMQVRNVGQCFSSKLTVTTANELNRMSVECRFGTSSIGSGLLKIIGPPSASLVIKGRYISQISATTASVVLHWQMEGENISGIVITSSPPLPCGSQCEVEGVGETGLEQTVEIGVEYNLTVRADNCGGRQTGSVSDTVKLLLNVPGKITGFSLHPVYSNTSGSLTELPATWNMVGNTEITGIDEVSDLVNYTVNISSISKPVTVSHAQCVGGQCSYLFRATGLLLPLSLSVSVTAFNAIGTGPPSSPLTVSTNNKLSVTVTNSKSSTGWKLLCSFLRDFPLGVSAVCQVSFGTDPSFTNLHYTDTSTEEVSAGGSVSVSISEPLNSSTTYYYQVSAIENGNTTVTVQGSFITGIFECDANQLVSDAVPLDSDECGDGQMGLILTTEGSSSQSGRVCYSGITPNSVASYMAFTGCVIRGGSTAPRTCTSSGQWSGEIAVVVCRGLSSSEVGLIAAGVVFHACAAALLVIGSVLFSRAECKEVEFVLLLFSVAFALLTLVLLASATAAWITVMAVWIPECTECRSSKHWSSILAASLLSLLSIPPGITWVVLAWLLHWQGCYRAVSSDSNQEAITLKENLSYGPINYLPPPASSDSTQDAVALQANLCYNPVIPAAVTAAAADAEALANYEDVWASPSRSM